MTAKTFSAALGKIDDTYLNEAISYKAKKKNSWLKWGSMVACLVLVLAVGVPCISDVIPPKGGPGQTDALRPLNVIEYNGAYYDVLDMEDTKLLDAYHLPHEITNAMVGAELGAGLDEGGNQTEEIFYLYTPYAGIAAEEANGDKRAQRAVYIVSKNGTYRFALFCNYIKYDTNTHEEIREMFAVYGVDAAEDIASVEIGNTFLDTASEIKTFFDALCSSKGMGNDDYQETIYGGMTEAEQQALSNELADSSLEVRMITNEGIVIKNLGYYPTIDYVYWGINYYKINGSLYND